MKTRDNLAVVPPTALAVSAPEQVIRWLIQHAARRAPGVLAERLAEEWQADVLVKCGCLARMRFAIGCCWASILMGRDPLAFGASPALAASGQGSLAAFGAHDSGFFSRRTTVLIFIVSLHMAAIYGLASGFRHANVSRPVPPPTKGRIYDSPKIQEVELPPIGVTKPESTIVAPPQPPVFELPPLTAPPDAGAVTITTSSSPGPPSGPVATRLTGGPGKGFPSTREFYSNGAILAEETGVTSVRVCVDAVGRLVSDPLVAASSGYPRLDKDALALARAGSGHYRSTTENGVPISDCYTYRVRFELR
jgi:hypothetical protein